MVSHFNGRTYAESISQQGAKKTHRGLNGMKHQDAGENFVIISFIPSIRHYILLTSPDQKASDGCEMWYVWERRKNHRGFRWRNMKERGQLEDLSIDIRILKWIFKKCAWVGGGME